MPCRIRDLPILLLAYCAAAAQLPSGTLLPVRLRTAVSTGSSKPGDSVRAVVIAPVGGLPAGAVVHGSVRQVAAAAAEQRASILLAFSSIEISGAAKPVSARVKVVDNARESVGADGRITGILASETLAGRLDSGIAQLAQEYSGLAGVLGALKATVLRDPDTDIVYPAGVEMQLELTAPLQVPAAPQPPPPSCPHRGALGRLVAHQPFLTSTEKPARPADLVNLVLIGSAPTLRRAFQEAGWSQAADLNALSRFEAFLAIAEERGYNEAPVSSLLLEGRRPDMVFEKLNDTFAQRHHLRVWQRPSRFEGQPVWAAAATHDVAISVSEQDRTFIHRIDPAIDHEREKVVDDLLFAGRVAEMDYIARPDVPREGRNATGDRIRTDGRAAVLILK